PSVWAWRPKRAKRMAAFVDHVLALLPFEPPYMQAEGIDCDFVGHPIVSTEMVTPKEIQSFRDAYAIDDSEMVLAVLPGSRKSELKRLLPIFGDVLADPKFRNRTLLFPTLPHLVAEISDFADALPHRCIVIAGKGKDAAADSRQRFVSYHIANAALAASGTVSLELAAAQTPMVIAYDMSWLSRTLISRMLLTDTVTLVNLVTETRDIPEFIGANCRADDIIPALHNLFKAPNCQLSVMDEAMHRLGYGGPPPGVRAAKAILDRLG
ncbi:MAG: lipid-A-disaccharide synthase, partial [Planktomarina sp.]